MQRFHHTTFLLLVPFVSHHSSLTFPSPPSLFALHFPSDLHPFPPLLPPRSTLLFPFFSSHLKPSNVFNLCTSLLFLHPNSSQELQFLVEHHLYRQQQGAGDECSSESCLSDRPSPDSVPPGEELPHDDEATAEAIEKLRCQMEGLFLPGSRKMA